MTGSLDGRHAVVTGAGNGIGRAVALALACRGVVVELVGRQVGKLDAVVDEILALGGSANARVCDVADVDAVDALKRELDGVEVSILVNNAGIAGPNATIGDLEPSDWDEVFDTNVRSVYLVCRAFAPQMASRGFGDIVNVASVTGKKPLYARSPYVASKAAVLGFTSALALEMAPSGVKVNSISPGPVKGPRMAKNFERDAAERGITVHEAERQFVSRAAAKRMVTDDEVSEGVLAILSMRGLYGADIDMTAGMMER